MTMVRYYVTQELYACQLRNSIEERGAQSIILAHVAAKTLK